MDEARLRLGHWLGVDARHLHFGPSTSQNSYVLAQAFASMLAPGDEIIVTNQDHEANSGVWRKLAERGFVLREWSVDADTGCLDPADLDTLLSDRTRLLTFHFYAPRVLDAMGVDSAIGVLRLSMVHYNTPGEVSDVIAALDEILP
jgi:selenocysteine lyase/cysteine desulfurase